jgi:hypothetical protein
VELSSSIYHPYWYQDCIDEYKWSCNGRRKSFTVTMFYFSIEFPPSNITSTLNLIRYKVNLKSTGGKSEWIIYNAKWTICNENDFDNMMRVMVMVFRATFNNSTVTSWCSVLLVDETGVPRENHQLSQVTNKLKIFKQYFTLRVFFFIYYSQTCIKRSPLGQRKGDLIRQVTF